MCGVAGIFGHSNNKGIIQVLYNSMSHRGGAGGGIVWQDDNLNHLLHIAKGKSAEQIFSADFLDSDCIGCAVHLRWPTSGSDSKVNLQPHYKEDPSLRIAVLSNGDIRNMGEQVQFLEANNIRIISENDAEMICGSIYWQIIKGKNPNDMVYAIRKTMSHLIGAYASILFSSKEKAMYAFRDPHGMRPLVLGILDGRYIVCSETIQLQAVGANFIREIRPGEIIRVSDLGLESFHGPVSDRKAFCSFESLYFSHPFSWFVDQFSNEISYGQIRKELGRVLAQEFSHIKADLVMPIPQSGIPATIGFSHASNIPYEQPIQARKGRTFTESDLIQRIKTAEYKYLLNATFLKGKKVIVVDDSAIRMLTVTKLVEQLRRVGVRGIHFLSAAPRYLHPCYYGSDTKDVWSLGARDKTPEELRRAVGMPDTFDFISLDGFKEVIQKYFPESCFACFDGDYPC